MLILQVNYYLLTRYIKCDQLIKMVLFYILLKVE